MLPWWYVIIVLQFWPMDAPSYLWNYDEPELWQETFPLCDSPLQSPIALTRDRIAYSRPPKLVPGDGLAEGEVTAINTGRRIELRLAPGNASQPAIQLVSYKKPLFGVYTLETIDLHWGDAGGTHGSEHAINKEFFDGEAQFVFYNNFYESMAKARRHPGGIAIVSVLLSGSSAAAGEAAFPSLGLEQQLDALAARGSEVTFAADLTPVHGLLSKALTRVLAYYGSLTSPPCNPVATWLVSAEPVDVSTHLLYDLATKVYEDRQKQKRLVNNWRPLQDRSGRLVTQLENTKP
ncbi:carbonic anhydrase 2-like [Amphibalanus amphitrite]|uniref:carbonic anhydrase 2-like n=1 Tax=Amphibalanus amphitrite TaxID=1232801 RepID=UPI001C8FE5E2|nr:carbonic anhydrase 2-like [Amphibalanus amphitrite]